MKLAISTLFAALAISSATQAATISQSTASAPASVNLTTQGTTDWIKLSYSGGVIREEKSGATSIGSFTWNGGGPNGQWNATSPTGFDWTDGETVASGTAVVAAAAGDTWGGNLFTLNVAAPAAGDFQLKLYMLRGNGVISLNATLPGATASSFSYPQTGYSSAWSEHTLLFTADNAGDTLQVIVSGGSSPDFVTPNSGLAAATLVDVTPIPEPTSIAALLAASSVLLRRKSRVSTL
jgi:hypothetical protein